MKKKYCIVLFFGILSAIIIALNRNSIEKVIVDIRKKSVGEPINIKTGLINNEFFSIETGENTDAEKNTKGINNAIKYAYENNIEYIKLKTGIYSIDGIGKKKEKKGIQIKSNITMDLNNSILKHKITNQGRYSVINIDDEENITVYNGIIVGDKEEHVYEKGTNEWGYGIEVVNSRNINIKNLEIYNFIGDGVLVTGKSINIDINNSNIHDCRRQGISICGGEKIKINNNEIYLIGGTNPQSGIDLETDVPSNKIKNIVIENNKIYATKSNLSIISSINVEDVKIINNELRGELLICDVANQIEIQENIIKDGNIHAYITKPIYNTNRSIDDIYIINNTIERGNILLNSQNKKIVYGSVEISKNTIKEGIIELYSINGTIEKNNIINSEEKEYFLKVGRVIEDQDQYKIKLNGNDIIGNYKNEIVKEKGIQIINE